MIHVVNDLTGIFILNKCFAMFVTLLYLVDVLALSFVLLNA